MSKITIGTIISKPADERRDLVWDAIKPLRESGYERGDYLIELGTGASLQVSLSSVDVAILHQIETLLDSIINANVDVVLDLAASDAPGDLLDVAWFSISPVRTVGYGEGEFTVKVPGGHTLKYAVTTWDAMIVERFDALLDRIAEENREQLDAA